jgi:spore coat polysaccharide biosynthesis protein SpsF
VIAAIVQARMSSRRLPGKVLRRHAGRRTLEYVLERLEHAQTLDKVIVATSTDPGDDPVAELCEEVGVDVQRGPLSDVAKRYLETVERFGLDAFVRITGDSPLIDQRLVDRGVRLFLQGDADVVTNVFPSTFPSGQSVEIVSADAFRRAYRRMSTPDNFEHVTNFFYRNPEGWRIVNFTHDGGNEGHLDVSLDTEEDARLLEAIFERMERPHWEYTSDDVISIYREWGAGR